MSSPLEVSLTAGVQQVRLTSRWRLNAYDLETAGQLLDTLERIAERSDIGAVVLAGDGPFCAGHDFNHFWRLHRAGDVESYRRLQETLGGLYAVIRKMPQLVIAVVEGTAAGGGCNLALAADCRIAGPEAAFCHPATTFGFPPELAAGSLLATVAGPALALDLLTTGRLMDAEEAARCNLVDLCEDPADSAGRLARRAAAGSGEHRRRVKRSVYRTLPYPSAEELEREIEERVRFFLSDECSEAFSQLQETGAQPVDQ